MYDIYIEVRFTEARWGRNIHVITKKMYSPGYHLNGFVATHALEWILHVLYIMSQTA